MEKKPNVILISLDTVRSDHLSCYGYGKKTTPEIDELLSDVTIYKRAYSTAVWTPPAHASMLTGLFPSEHGVVDQNSLSSNIKTVAEVLKKNGYLTAGFVNNSQVGELVGFDRGHDDFSEIWKGIKSKNIVKRGARYLDRQFKKKFGLYDNGARETTSKALHWIDMNKDRDEPFYLFLHYIDAHNPLTPPRKYKNKTFFSGTSSIKNKNNLDMMVDNPLSFYTTDINLAENDLNILIGLYDSCLLYLDSRMGRIVSYLKENKLYENSLIIITADHGEHFGEKSNFSHVSSLYKPIINVPMIIKYPHGQLRGEAVDASVQHTDIVPTILAVSNTDAQLPYSLPGANLADNKSKFHDFVISEWEGRVPYFILRELNCDVNDQQVEKFRRKLTAIQNDKYKLILHENEEIELYDILEDKYEETNIAENQKEIAEMLVGKLTEWKNQIKTLSIEEDKGDMSDEVIENLKALGYM